VPGIGRPIANTRAYVLDRQGAPVPIGVPGELYLGGAGVARGYLGRPGLTAARVVPDPFGSEAGADPGGRLYRTGDRVRWRADGTLEFLGRLDQQVKVRGFRVEPGEIEATLTQHPGVHDCAVVLREDLPTGRELVAYVVPREIRANGADAARGNGRPEYGVSTAEIRRHLRARLPEQMIPSAFVVLEALPLTPNGKLDRRALPLPDGTLDEADAGFVPPCTPMEVALAQQWCELLGVQRVGLQDNFFALGGHSLLAVRLFAEIERTHHRKLPLSTLFQAPTLGQLAELLSQAVGPELKSGPALLRAGSGAYPPLFLVHLHYGDVLEYRELVSHLPQDLTIYGCEAPDDGQQGAVLRTIEALAAHHVRQIRQTHPTGPYLLCGLCWAGLVAFEMAAQLREAGEEVALLALIDTSCPGSERSQRVHRRVQGGARKIWRLTAQNLRKLRALDPRDVPGFLRQRFSNIVIRMAGVAAFRWSVRFQRPLLPVFREMSRALLHAGWSYRARPYPGRITLFRVAVKASGRTPDPFVGWASIARDGLEVHEVSGGHNTMMREPYVETLAVRLLACLEQVRAGRSEVMGAR
jgi:aspartate racemase